MARVASIAGGLAMTINTAIPDITNPFYEQSVDLSRDDIFTLAGFTMCGPGLGKAVRERFVAVAAGILRKHGPRAFEMPRRAAAIHEAGHVVINSVLGVRTTSAVIEPLTRDGKLFWIGMTSAPKLAFVDTPATPVGFDEILARSRITYAGLVAEILFAGEDRREGSSLDEVLMSQILAEHAASLIGIDAARLWRDEVSAWCANELHRNRKAHAKIAGALMERKRLKGRALRELCQKVKPLPVPEEHWPDIHDYTSQLANAGIHAENPEGWA
jgi:hypothetical protein